MYLKSVDFYRVSVFPIGIGVIVQCLTRQVYNLSQEPVEQPLLGFSIAEEKIGQF